MPSSKSPVKLKDIEKELNIYKNKGDVAKYLEYLGDSIVVLTRKIIELEAIIEDNRENITGGSLTNKERLAIKKHDLRYTNLKTEIESMKTTIQNLKQ